MCTYLCMYVCSIAKSHPTLCNLMDCSLPGSSVHGIFQARILEHLGGHFLLQGIFPDSGMKPVSPALAGEFFITEPPRRQ